MADRTRSSLFSLLALKNLERKFSQVALEVEEETCSCLDCVGLHADVVQLPIVQLSPHAGEMLRSSSVELR